MSAFSFYPTKNMTTGEGGMVVARSPEVAHRARLLRNQGMERQYENELAGFNARLTEIAAAIGRVQLGRLEGFTAARRANAARYDEGLRSVVPPPVEGDAWHVYHQYTVRSLERDRLIAGLEARGVEARVYYPTPTHLLPVFGRSDLDLPETARAAREVVSLPVAPHLSEGDVAAVIDAVEASAS